MSDQRVLRYQVMWKENLRLTTVPFGTVNLATLLPLPEESLPFYSCLGSLNHWTKPSDGLSEDPMANCEKIWYTDGSSFVLGGKRRGRYAIVSNHETLEAKSLPPETSSQLAELVVLTWALELGKGKRVAIYTNFRKYTFLVWYAHGAIWKERAHSPLKGPQSSMMSQTLRLLEACLLRFQPHLPHLPAEVSASHCRGYQKGSTEEPQGNHAAHKAAKRAALQSNCRVTDRGCHPSSTDYFTRNCFIYWKARPSEFHVRASNKTILGGSKRGDSSFCSNTSSGSWLTPYMPPFLWGTKLSKNDWRGPSEEEVPKWP